jgi:hypothetical protein
VGQKYVFSASNFKHNARVLAMNMKNIIIEITIKAQRFLENILATSSGYKTAVHRSSVVVIMIQ